MDHDAHELRAELDHLMAVARNAAGLLREIDANANTGRPQDITAIRETVRALDAAVRVLPT